MTEPARLTPAEIADPCPFCGTSPQIYPKDPEREGNAFGQVRCEYNDCPAKPCVNDGEYVRDERGPDAYKAAAIARWNSRVVDIVAREQVLESLRAAEKALAPHIAAAARDAAPDPRDERYAERITEMLEDLKTIREEYTAQGTLIERLVRVLTTLIGWKDHKEKIGKTDSYRYQMPYAWEEARYSTELAKAAGYGRDNTDGE